MFVVFNETPDLDKFSITAHLMRGDGHTKIWVVDYTPDKLLTCSFTLNNPHVTSLLGGKGEVPVWAAIAPRDVRIDGNNIVVMPPVPKGVYFMVTYSFEAVS